jgi:RHS repeat-associated protein
VSGFGRGVVCWEGGEDFLITFDYGPNQERVRMKVTQNDTLRYTRYYFGGYELTEYPGSDTLKDTWFPASSGVFGFHRETGSTDSIYYVIRDHLGSIMTVVGEDGNAREFFSYDAWGRRRDASDWTYDSTLTANYTTRGYTGHEHIDETYLINMNGRVYDPLVGLFLSPDPILQEPMNPLNYNRYSYVLNNPLKYTDPSGYTYYRKRFQWEQDVTEGMNFYAGAGGSSRSYHFDPLNYGSGGGFTYGDRISAMGGDPRGWGYNTYTQEWYNARTGDRRTTPPGAMSENMNVPQISAEQANRMDIGAFMNPSSAFILVIEKHYGSNWIVGLNLRTGAKSSFSGINSSSNLRNYWEASVIANAKNGGGDTGGSRDNISLFRYGMRTEFESPPVNTFIGRFKFTNQITQSRGKGPIKITQTNTGSKIFTIGYSFTGQVNFNPQNLSLSYSFGGFNTGVSLNNGITFTTGYSVPTSFDGQTAGYSISYTPNINAIAVAAALYVAPYLAPALAF